jgi:trehalose 6-phosphate phosphatase
MAGGLPRPRTKAGDDGLRQVLERPEDTLFAFDFDGVLSPIVDDPEAAYAHPDVLPLLVALDQRIRTLAIITGRPAETVVRLGGFAGQPGLAGLVVVGHYGEERWDARTGQVTAPPVDPGVAEVRRSLPGLLRRVGAPEGTTIEEKGRSVAVHVRRTKDPATATALLTEPLTALAEQHGLIVQPGRMVIELKPSGMDKGVALRRLVEEFRPRCVGYAGDDLGDLPAYDTVDQLREEGLAGLLLCSGSTEVTALAERADIVVDGPPGVVAFLRQLVAHLEA